MPVFCLVSISATINVADSSAVSFRTSVVNVLSPRSIVVAAAEPAAVTAVSIVSTSSFVTVAVIMAARSGKLNPEVVVSVTTLSAVWIRFAICTDVVTTLSATVSALRS